MNPPRTIVAFLVSLRFVDPPGLRSTPVCLCLDCNDALSREERAATVYVGDVHSWETTVRHCDRCQAQVNGPIHLDPGASSWGPNSEPKEGN